MKRARRRWVRSLRLVWPTLLLATVLGCRESRSGPTSTPVGRTPEPPSDPAAFRTDSDSYTLRKTEWGFEATIRVVFTNPSARPVFIVNCNGATMLRLQRWNGTQWIQAWAPLLNACLSPPIMIPGASRYESTVTIADCSLMGSCAPKFASLPQGEFHRLMWDDVMSRYDVDAPTSGPRLSERERVSNAFALRTPGR